MNVLNSQERRKAKFRVLIIYGVSLILISSGFVFFSKVEKSDYSQIKAVNSSQKALLSKMRDIRSNITALERYDEALVDARQNNKINAMGRIKLSIDSCMQNIDAVLVTMERDGNTELEQEIYENYKIYQADREVIAFLQDELENIQNGGGEDAKTDIIIKDLVYLINEADNKINGAGKRASKDELTEVKQLVSQLKNKASML